MKKPNLAENFNQPPETDIIALAEAETPAEIAPAFESNEPARKSHRPLYAVVTILCLAIISGSLWFLLDNKSKHQTATDEVQNNLADTPALEPIEASKLILRGNDLSDFDLAFLHLENKPDNVIYSPLSIKYALAMLKDGSNGRSKEQIEAVIGDYTPKSYLNSANRSLANAIFIRDSFAEKVLPSYTDTLKNNYNASVLFDPFTSAANINKWVGDQTLGIINQLVEDDDVKALDFMLVNALAIDMNWNNQLQCAPSENATASASCNYNYDVKYAHEKYTDWVSEIFDEEDFDKITFNNHENVKSAKIGASINRYDIVSELGEDYIRNTVRSEYIKYLEEQIAANKESLEDPEATDWQKENLPAHIAENEAALADPEPYLDQYISELSANFGKLNYSTDFYFLDTDTERVFAKDLKEYDGSTLQYVAIMPKSGSLNAYLNSLTAEKASDLISNLRNPADSNNFKDGVITKITAHIPFFKFSYEMKDFMANLKQLGITDVFEQNTADLTGIVSDRGEYIDAAIHKADIEFSNDGIKAAAVSSFGGRGAAGPGFDYKFDVPVEEIDLTFDNPFLFLIRDKSTGEVWFTGTVYDPSCQ